MNDPPKVETINTPGQDFTGEVKLPVYMIWEQQPGEGAEITWDGQPLFFSRVEPAKENQILIGRTILGTLHNVADKIASLGFETKVIEDYGVAIKKRKRAQ